MKAVIYGAVVTAAIIGIIVMLRAACAYNAGGDSLNWGKLVMGETLTLPFAAVMRKGM